MAVTIKNEREIERMRRASHVVAVIHSRIEAAIRPGVTTKELDEIARETLKEFGAKSSFLGHTGPNNPIPFPGVICASVNDEIVHGIPGKRVLQEGDIVSIDVGAIVEGYHGDSAWTYPVGEVSELAAKLLKVTEEALYRGIEQARPGNRVGAIGHAIEEFIRPTGFGMVREYGGHGIGRQMWEEPHVPNHGDPNRGIILRPGMTLAIEPMVNTGGDETRVLPDTWTVVTADGSLSAHFEHTIAITENGPEILTKRLTGVVH
ncbi:MAG TPA: type I methionyl aminopeptidase [Thermomicrobiales bacterium]